MHPPPSNTVIQHLKRGYIFSVSFGKYTIHLVFDNANRLSFAAPFKFGEAKKLSMLQASEFPISESGLMRILGCEVFDVACEKDGSLTLVFSNGDALVVYANDPMYEAYTLLIDGHEYVV